MKVLFNILLTISISIIFTSCGGDKTSSAKSSDQSQIGYPEFYHGCNKIKTMLDEQRLDEAMTFFDGIAAQVPRVPSKYYYTFAQKAAESNNCDQAVKYLKLAIENGKEYNAQRSDFKKIRPCPDALKEIIASEKTIHDKTFNYDYKIQIDSMFAKDKRYRKKKDFSNIQTYDSINKKQLISLYNKYGYPSEQLVGDITAQSARIMMLRTDPDNGNETFLPLFKEAYLKGYLNAREYAGFTDRRLSQGINYTAPYYYEMPTHDYQLMIEVERAEIDRRRDSIGLLPKPRPVGK